MVWRRERSLLRGLAGARSSAWCSFKGNDENADFCIEKWRVHHARDKCDGGVGVSSDIKNGLVRASPWIVRSALERRRLRLQGNSARAASRSQVRCANVYSASESMRRL